MLKVSFIGGFAGFVAEYWYFKDYWQPPTLMGKSVISIEDFLFGFTIMGIAVSIYEFLFSVKVSPVYRNRKKMFGRMFLIGIICMMLFNIQLGINSIIVSSIVFVLYTVFMLVKRPDLRVQAIASGLFTLAVVIPIYALLFNVINTTYWDSYWMLARTHLGVTVFGNIPVTELLWYFTFGCFAGIAHSFASGRAEVKIGAEINLVNDIPVPAVPLEVVYNEVGISD